MHVSAHLGFDNTFVYSTHEMLTWWKSSPYYDVGVYLPNALNRKNDPGLTPKWVSTVVGQGWTIIPIWYGLQAPQSPTQCIEDPQDLEPFSLTPAVAYQEGQQEADCAMQNAVAIGISGGIIYKDLEQYYDKPADTACDTAAKSYVQGWTSELEAFGWNAGVYGGGGNADAPKDWPDVPDDVWIKTWPSSVTPWYSVWGILGSKDSKLWFDQNRLAQYQGNQMQAWGDNNELPLDLDMEYGPVVGGSGTKNYKLSVSTLDYAGGTGTSLNTVNNEGEIAASYTDSSSNSHGLLYSNGTFTTFDCAGSTQTIGAALNNQRQIVGSYETSDGNWYSFMATFQNGAVGSCTPLAIKGATGESGSFAGAINDAGWIAGSYFDSNNAPHGYLYKPPYKPSIDFSTIDYPGALFTYATGINGQGQIVGNYYTQTFQEFGFLYSPGAAPPYATIPNCTGYANIFPQGINDDGLIVGGADLSNGTVVGFLYNGKNCVEIQETGTTDFSANAVSDLAQLPTGQLVPLEIVGTYNDSSNKVHGFTAFPVR